MIHLIILSFCTLACMSETREATTSPPSEPQGSLNDRVQDKTYYFKDALQTMPYTLYVPTTYDPAQATPLTVMLHGIGGDSTLIYDPTAALVEQAERHGHILVCPTGYNTQSWYGAQEIYNDKDKEVMAETAVRNGFPDDMARAIYDDDAGKLGYRDVMNVIDIVRADYNVDASRIYLTGHSMGGGGVYYIASKNPSMFAALGTMAPGIGTSSSLLLDIKHIPVICIQGTEDVTVRPFMSQYWAAWMKVCGMTHSYIEYPGEDHNSVVRHAGDIFAFLEQHRKSQHPHTPAKSSPLQLLKAGVLRKLMDDTFVAIRTALLEKGML